MLGPLLLLKEFTEFRPNAAKGFSWKDYQDTSPGDFFLTNFVLPYALNPATLSIMQMNFQGEDNPYLQEVGSFYRHLEETRQLPQSVPTTS